MGNWWDEFVETAEGALDAGQRFVGEVVDSVTDVAGDVLDKIGLDDLADTVEDVGDQIADTLGATPDEKQLEDDVQDPKELVHGDPGALRDSGAKVTAFATNFDLAGTGLQGISVGDFSGESADAYQQSMRAEVAKWLAAADACESAATGFGDMAAAVEWAQTQAAEAIRLWNEAKRLRAEWEQKVNDYNDAVDDYNAGNTTVKPTDPGPDPSPAVRQQAKDTLKKGRDHRNQVGDQVAATWNGAADKAPPEPPAGQRALATAFDIQQAAQTAGNHFSVGLVNGLTDIVKTVRTINPTDPYNIAHPADYLRNVSAAAAGLTDVAANPEKLITGFIGDGWSTDPAQSAGVLTSQLIPLGPPGASVAAGLARVGIRTAVKDGLQTGVRTAVTDGIKTSVKDGLQSGVKGTVPHATPALPSARLPEHSSGHDGTPAATTADAPAPRTDAPAPRTDAPAPTHPAEAPTPDTPQRPAADHTPNQRDADPVTAGAQGPSHTPEPDRTPEPTPSQHSTAPTSPHGTDHSPTAPEDRQPSAPDHTNPDRPGPGPGPSETTTPTHGPDHTPSNSHTTATDHHTSSQTPDSSRHSDTDNTAYAPEQRPQTPAPHPDEPTTREHTPDPQRTPDSAAEHGRTPAAASTDEHATSPHTAEPRPGTAADTPSPRPDHSPTAPAGPLPPIAGHPAPTPHAAPPHGSAPHGVGAHPDTPTKPAVAGSVRPEPPTPTRVASETPHRAEPQATPAKNPTETPTAAAKSAHEPGPAGGRPVDGQPHAGHAGNGGRGHGHDGTQPPPPGGGSHPSGHGDRPEWVQRVIDGELDRPTDPAQMRELWHHLDPDERTGLFRQDPMFGDNARLPVTVCDEYSRDALSHWGEQMPDNQAYRSIEEAIQQHPNQPRRYLLGFEPDGRSITSVGNPDTASRTGVLVPGTFTDAGKLVPGTNHPGYMEVAQRFQDNAKILLGREGSAAVVDWQNYHAPQSLFPGAARDSFAEAGAPRLRDFLERLDHTNQIPDARRTVIGHSYGAVVVGEAAQGAGLNAHSVVTLGGAGMHARTVEDLILQGIPLEPGSAPVWALMHPNDPIRLLEVTDRTPIGHGRMTHREDFGAHPEWIEERTGPWITNVRIGAHSAYWELNSRSLDIIGEIIAGLRQ